MRVDINKENILSPLTLALSSQEERGTNFLS
jgi:hypothetical protein